jgi:hypothetical protein
MEISDNKTDGLQYGLAKKKKSKQGHEKRWL